MRIAVLAVLVAQTGCATTDGRRALETGEALFSGAFDPDRLFAEDLLAGTFDEVVLTVQASNRDDYAPAYSLAIAYRCLPTGTAGQSQCGYTARTLRVGPRGDGQIERSFALLARAASARGDREMERRLNEAGLEWLEADVLACPQGVFAMDSVRVADWNPDIHFALQPEADREIIMHPAMIRVTMAGSYTRTEYRGWVLANGVPAAVRQLLDTLEPCWTPATSPRPWERPAPRR